MSLTLQEVLRRFAHQEVLRRFAPQMTAMFYVVDRIEGKVAVIVGDGRTTFDVPRAQLPKGAGEGSVLKVLNGTDGKPDWKTAAIDKEEEGRRRGKAMNVLKELRKKDPGGDVTI